MVYSSSPPGLSGLRHGSEIEISSAPHKCFPIAGRRSTKGPTGRRRQDQRQQAHYQRGTRHAWRLTCSLTRVGTLSHPSMHVPPLHQRLPLAALSLAAALYISSMHAPLNFAQSSPRLSSKGNRACAQTELSPLLRGKVGNSELPLSCAGQVLDCCCATSPLWSRLRRSMLACFVSPHRQIRCLI